MTFYKLMCIFHLGLGNIFAHYNLNVSPSDVILVLKQS